MKRRTALLITYFFISIAFFSSCATILNPPTQRIYITTDSTIKQVIVDKIAYVDNNAYYVVRNKIPLVITLISDSIEKEVILKPMNSFAFWWNINMNDGLGMLIDKDNPKRYCYQKRNYFSFKDSTISHKRFKPIPKGSFDISLSVSPVNSLNVRANNQLYSLVTIFGVETGLNYHYDEKYFISITIGANGNRTSPVDHIGPGFVEWEKVLYLNLRNNNIIRDFSFGYGLNISQFEWGEYLNQNPDSSTAISNTAVGLSFSAQYRLGEYLHFGFMYQPDFYSLKTLGWNYQEYTVLSLIWKFPF